MSQLNLLGEAMPPPESVRAELDVDCTPCPVAYQIAEEVTRDWLRKRDAPPRVLDVCAGAGPWARAARLLFPDAHITALELRADQRPYLERWANEVIIGDVVKVVTRSLAARMSTCEPADAERLDARLKMLGVTEPVGSGPVLGGYDLIIGNPPFSLPDARVPAKKDKDGNPPPPGAVGKSRLRAFEVLVVAMREFMATSRSRMAYYVPSAWWQRGEDIARFAPLHEPYRQLNVPLGVCHRGPGHASAPDSYSAFVWLSPDVAKEPGRHTVDLPVLDAADRRWSVVPGSESI